MRHNRLNYVKQVRRIGKQPIQPPVRKQEEVKTEGK